MVEKGFKDIQVILDKLLTNYNLETPVKRQILFDNWVNIVGKNLAEKCSPINIENKTLFLKAKNSVWRNELKLREKDLIKIIHDKSGIKFIMNIKFL